MNARKRPTSVEMGRNASDGLPTLGDARHTLHLLLAVLVGVALLAFPTSAQASPADTLVIGDSITWRGADKLAAMHPNWTIDGVRGRGLTSLVPVLKLHIAAEGIPSTLVIALGTNSHPDATGAEYTKALALVPASTKVVFVTLYRDPVKFGQATADRMRVLSAVMNDLAADRPNTEVAWWRAVAVQHPELLEDGVHETDPDGEIAWAAQVDAAVAR